MLDGVTAGVPASPFGLVPVLPAFETLLPAGGLPKGSITAVQQPGLLSLALAAAASQAGSWCGVAGLTELGVVAAAEAGMEPRRMIIVPAPGPRWAEVTAELLGACDVVLLQPPARVPAQARRRVETVTRRTGAVLIVTGSWDGVPLRMRITQQRWDGIGAGHGRLQARLAEVITDGRGAAAQPRHKWLWLPGQDGQIRAAETADHEGMITGEHDGRSIRAAGER